MGKININLSNMKLQDIITLIPQHFDLTLFISS